MDSFSTFELIKEVENRMQKQVYSNALKRIMLKSLYKITSSLKGKK